MFEDRVDCFVYVLRSKKDGKRYIGLTSDFSRRFKQHQRGGVTSTRSRVPFESELVETYPNRSLARKREVYFKSAAGRRFLDKIFAEMVELADTHV